MEELFFITIEDEESYGMKENYCKVVLQLMEVLKKYSGKIENTYLPPFVKKLKKLEEYVEELHEIRKARLRKWQCYPPPDELKNTDIHFKQFLKDFDWIVMKSKQKIFKLRDLALRTEEMINDIISKIKNLLKYCQNKEKNSELFKQLREIAWNITQYQYDIEDRIGTIKSEIEGTYRVWDSFIDISHQLLYN